MPSGGRLSITTSNAKLDDNYTLAHPGVAPGPYVLLTVSDTGTGITDEVKAHLFEPFFTTKPKGKGTGLGLATCETIVKQCGGHTTVTSAVGQGATFNVYFPAVDEPLDAAQPLFQVGAPLPRGTETLLVVEAERSVRDLIGHILEAQGYTVLRAFNGQDGLRKACENDGPPVRLVITDVNLPSMCGNGVIGRMKLAGPELKILSTSSCVDDASMEPGRVAAGRGYLPKPFTPAELACKVRAMLDQSVTNPPQ
jgi:CheY-like chemotaxis protein